MKNAKHRTTGKTPLLKESRLQLLRLHKALLDIERADFEKANGQITSGQFLNLLLNEESFQWLRKFSTLIVDIDEMLDLDDGYSEETVEEHLSEMRKIVEAETSDEEFNDKYRVFMEKDSEIVGKNKEIKTLLADR